MDEPKHSSFIPKPASGTASLATWPSSVWDGHCRRPQHSPDTANPQMVTILPNYQCVVSWATHLGVPIPILKIQEQEGHD